MLFLLSFAADPAVPSALQGAATTPVCGSVGWVGCSGMGGLLRFCPSWAHPVPTGLLGGTANPSSLPLGSEVPSRCSSSHPTRSDDVGAAQAEQEQVEAQTFAVLPFFSLLGVATTSRSSLRAHNGPFPASRANRRHLHFPRGRG